MANENNQQKASGAAEKLSSPMASLTVQEFTARLSGKDPVPGGGGASAIAAALGAALGSMTASLALGKKKYADHQEELQELVAEFQEVSSQLLACADQDADSFLPLLAAYKLPHATPQEQLEKEKALDAALLKANEAPLAIMHLSLKALQLISEAAEKGSRMAVSDAGAGAKLAGAALEAASLNVYINAKAMKDRAAAANQKAQADQLVREGSALADQIYQKVLSEIRGE